MLVRILVNASKTYSGSTLRQRPIGCFILKTQHTGLVPSNNKIYLKLHILQTKNMSKKLLGDEMMVKMDITDETVIMH